MIPIFANESSNPCFGFFSNPVAITVITISSPKSSLIEVPNIIFASGSQDSVTKLDAAFASNNVKLPPPATLIILL